MEELGLVVVKENFLVKLKNAFKRLFVKENIEILNQEETTNELVKLQEITDDDEFVQKEIIDARRAFRKYVINNTPNISKDILQYIKEKVQENQLEIRQLIRVNNDEVTYEELIELIENEIATLELYKQKDSKTGCYNVPVGVVGVECSNSKESIKAILKAISTRNAVVVLHDNYNRYSTESLILLIVKECLKNFYIDDNIIQIFQYVEIDLSKLDKIILNEDIEEDKRIQNNHEIYIYQEDKKYEGIIKKEISRLKKSDEYKSYKINYINGNFGSIIDYLNKNNLDAVCMYTNNRYKAYKFINWVNSPNIFINTGIQNCNVINSKNEYFNNKYVLHEDVF